MQMSKSPHFCSVAGCSAENVAAILYAYFSMIFTRSKGGAFNNQDKLLKRK
jgi:hypothetical protein